MFIKTKNAIAFSPPKSSIAVYGLLLPFLSFLFFTPSEHETPAPTLSLTTGKIQGRIEIKTTLTTRSRQWGARYRARGQSEWGDRTQKASRPEVTNVVVYLEEMGMKRSYAPPRQPARLVQENTEFIPHVLPVLKGSKVEIVNSDHFYHNVFSNSNVKKFNIGRQLTSVVITQTFDEIGFVPVFCDIHLEMSAYIVVLGNPYFAMPDESGLYTIDSVPAGQYRIIAWHERLVAESREITVPEEGSITVDFTL